MSASNAAVPDTMEGVLAQNRAYRTLCASLEAQMAILTEKGRQYQEAVTTLDSEREANAILTDELTALRTQVSELRADLEVARACLIDHLQYMKKPEWAPIIQRIDATLSTIRKDG